MAFTDPIATTAVPFSSSTAAPLISPATYFTYTGSKIIPTNAWWQNLLINYVDGGNYNGKTATLPFYQWPASNGKGVTVSYYGANDRDVAATALTLSSNKDVTIGVSEAITTRQITDYTDLGVNLKLNTVNGSMAMNLVHGMAFHGATYVAATPVIAIENAILTINGSTPGSATLSGVSKLKIVTNRNSYTWLVYASSAISFTLSGNVLTATAAFTGTLQLTMLDTSANETLYDTASTSVLTGGTVNSTFSGNTATMVFSYTTTGSGTPLVYALPHHQDVLTSPTYAGPTLLTIRGTMKAIQAATWTMSLPLTTLTWQAPNALGSQAQADIAAALAIEKNSTSDSVGNGYGMSPYYGGKYVAKMARMILIAQQLGDSATASSISSSLKTFMNGYLSATPTGTEGVNGSGYVNCLMYQNTSTWKGIVTQNGLADIGADFGNGRYNDHHYHYGYWIYAASVLAKDDATWLSTYKTRIEALIRDIANPSYSDTAFPKFRHKDWFSGHSWASGLVGLDVGPDQESVSEAINAWYAIHLWGTATANTDMTNLGRLMLATEVQAAKRYWHIYDSSDIYPAPFSANGTVVSVRTHKVAVETYFGSQPHYFYGIEALPYTPAAELYLDANWVNRVYAAASALIPTTSTSNPQDTAWDSLIYGMHAVINPSAGYAEAQGLTVEQIPEYTSYVQYGRRIDNGHSKTNALYWAATRSASSSTQTATAVTLGSNPATTAVSGATVTLSVTVSPAVAGSVAFKDSSSTLGTVIVTGSTASLVTTSLGAGSHSLYAVFTPSDSTTYAGSTSAVLTYIITASSSSSSSTSLANPITFVGYGYGPVASLAYHSIADVNYTLTDTDTIVAYTSLTASRIISLPAASGVTTGKEFTIKDESGSCASGRTITIAGTVDTATNVVLSAAYTKVTLYSNGAAWFSIR